MRKILISILLFLGIFQLIYSQTIDYSIYLASGDGVYSKPSSVEDKNGNIFVVGATRDGLKVTPDSFQKKYSGYNSFGGGDMFLMKLSPDGELLYSTYIGGSGSDYLSNQIILDDEGNVYIGFTTKSDNLKFSKDAFQKKYIGNSDLYIIKFSNSCKYLGSTYLGGSEDEVNPLLTIYDNKLYVVATTTSKDYPVTKNVLQNSYNEFNAEASNRPELFRDISISVLSLGLDKVLYSTYLGGKKNDSALSIAFDKNGYIILCGTTHSENFPTTPDAPDLKFEGKTEGFVSILKPNLSKVIFSTFIGGEADDNINSVEIYDKENIILAGTTRSKEFFTTSDALYKELKGESDGFLQKLNLSTKQISYSSLLGGSASDRILKVAKTHNQKFVLVGETRSKDYPITENAFDKIQNGPILKTHQAGWFNVTEDEILYEGTEDLTLVLLDKTLKKIEYSTFLGGSRDDSRYGFTTANLSSKNCLFISTLTRSHDFPTSDSFANFPGCPRIQLIKINLNK